MKMHSMLIKIIGLLFLLISSGYAAVTKDSPSIAQKPHKTFVPQELIRTPAQKVIFGIYVMSLYDFDPDKGTFKINFYSWWRTNDKNYNPEKSIEIVNAQEYDAKPGTGGKNGDEYYTDIHYYAVINKFWDYTYFPFDLQSFVVTLEDQKDINQLYFEPDYQQSGIDSEFAPADWDVKSFQIRNGTSLYNTNFGDISTPKSIYSRITFTIMMKHHGWKLYFNYFLGFFIAAFFSGLLYFILGKGIQAEIEIILAGIFAFIGNKYVVSAISSHPTQSYSLYETIELATLVMMTLSIVFYTFVKFYLEKRLRSLKNTCYTVGYIMLFIYSAIIILATYYAVTA